MQSWDTPSLEVPGRAVSGIYFVSIFYFLFSKQYSTQERIFGGEDHGDNQLYHRNHSLYYQHVLNAYHVQSPELFTKYPVLHAIFNTIR